MRPPSRDTPNDLEQSDHHPDSSEEVATPRGGFMARPGLKRPPQHAVVVRVGDAAPSEHIPLARSSVPPPPPVSTDELSVGVPTLPTVSLEGPDTDVPDSEKVTLRALTPPASPIALSLPNIVAAPIEPAVPAPTESAFPVPIESLPPPSDMPVVASVAPTPGRAQRSRWAVALAAAAGLVLGLASVVTSGRWSSGPPSAGAPAAQQAAEPVALTQPVLAPALSVAKAAPSASAAPAPSAGRALPAAERPVGSAARRSIF